ncbi:MAG: LPS-assembly protein LptD [Sphaerospermopsis sp. SIO1G2]|nr:LPS-assembly protein LptD [Sphaerospermopsis sp. SIO1G2]
MSMMRKLLYIAIALLPAHIYASEGESVFMEADALGYDQLGGIVVARGNVEVVRGEHVLFADNIYYYQKEDIVKAKGNISLLQADGNVLFADNLILDKEFSRGIIREFRARLSDNSAFAAAEARQIDQARTELTRAVYSPCEICEDTPEKPPLWQIKSDIVRIDTEAQCISYRDAILEVWGVPIAYTPYFVHPTPDADRASGILRPEYAQSGNLGVSIRVPYYINIAPDKDATITPWLTSKEGPVLIGEYRQRTNNGYFQFNGSATFPAQRDNTTGEQIAGNEFRGHIFARGGSQLSDHWRWGFDVNRASDDTYLRRYRFGNFDTLTSRAFVERLEDRDYTVIEGLTFQGLEENDDPGQEPVITPSITVHVESDPLVMNSRASAEVNLLALTRDEGTETRRFSAQTQYRVPHVTDGGHILEAEAGLRSDIYHQSNLTLANGEEFNGSTARLVPHAALSWRYPLISQVGSTSITVEPQAKIVASTRGHNADTIANEDSVTPEFNYLNLMRSNRFAGYDRMDEGTRAMVGLHTQAALSSSDVVSATIGHEMQLDGNSLFPASNDPSRKASDIVGQVGYDGRHLTVDAMYRIGTDDFQLRRAELRSLYQYDLGSLSASYVRIHDDAVLEDRNDLMASASLQATDALRFHAFGNRNLLTQEMVIAGVGAVYDYDCLTIQADVIREFTRDRDIEPDTSFTVRLGLQNLN